MTREFAVAKVTEADTTRPGDHITLLRNVTCGGKGCRDRAHRWMRCATCKTLVARCGAHDRDLPTQTKEHCR